MADGVYVERRMARVPLSREVGKLPRLIEFLAQGRRKGDLGDVRISLEPE